MSTTPGDARRAPPARPTTPLRPPSRSSLRATSTHHTTSNGSRSGEVEAMARGVGADPLETMLEPQFAELVDGMADLEANLVHLQLQHESLARFTESFAAFLYGMEVNAFCVDFPEAPVSESFTRTRNPEDESSVAMAQTLHENDTDATFLTTDTSFVENPPTSIKPPSRFSTPGQQPSQSASHRGGTSRGRGRGIPTHSHPSGLARATPRGGTRRVPARTRYR